MIIRIVVGVSGQPDSDLTQPGAPFAQNPAHRIEGLMDKTLDVFHW